MKTDLPTARYAHLQMLDQSLLMLLGKWSYWLATILSWVHSRTVVALSLLSMSQFSHPNSSVFFSGIQIGELRVCVLMYLLHLLTACSKKSGKSTMNRFSNV